MTASNSATGGGSEWQKRFPSATASQENTSPKYPAESLQAKRLSRSASGLQAQIPHTYHCSGNMPASDGFVTAWAYAVC